MKYSGLNDSVEQKIMYMRHTWLKQETVQHM